MVIFLRLALFVCEWVIVHGPMHGSMHGRRDLGNGLGMALALGLGLGPGMIMKIFVLTFLTACFVSNH